MTPIGIDMGKRTFWASIGGSPAREYANDDAGIKKFLAAIEEQDIQKSNATIGTESTGAYHLLFASRLTAAGWKVLVMNPLATSRILAAQSLRRLKTDKRDAVAICQLVTMGVGYPFTDTPEALALKDLIVSRNGLVAMRATVKQRREAHAAKEKAAPGLRDSSPVVLSVLRKEILSIEKEFSRYAPGTQALLRSIPGVGVYTAAVLVAFVGDIRRFSSPEKLVAYIGLDCRVHESGTSVKGKGYITKRGNVYLRRALWSAAFIARQKIPYLKAYFLKKTKKERKHYLSAAIAVERKLAHLVYAVWTRGTPYEERP